MNKKALQMLGLAARSGKVSSGTMACENSMIRGRARLLILSTDIAGSSREQLLSYCERLQVPWVEFGDRYQLGAAVGKAYRVAVTVNDKRLAAAVLDLLAAGRLLARGWLDGKNKGT